MSSVLARSLKVDACFISRSCQNRLLLFFDALCSVRQEQTEPCSAGRRTAFPERLTLPFLKSVLM